MSSSDSEDDCYGNIAKKLQSMKNKYRADKDECSSVLNESFEINEIVQANFGAKTETNDNVNSAKVIEDSFELDDDSELNKLLAGSSKRVTRAASKRTKQQNDSIVELPSPTRRKSEESPSEPSRGRRGRGRGRRGQNNSRSTGESDSSTSRGQNVRRGRGRRGQATPRNRRGSRHRLYNNFPVFNMAAYPIFSVGNTDEYPDQCENQNLFSSKPQPQNEVVVIDENDTLDENEELSVKIYWQNSEYFKFTIRKFQKITTIFDFFANKENVSHDKLLFTFNDRILKSDDTPDSIQYNIAKFIDGGIVNQSVTTLVTNEKENVTNGIKLKFQCQNVKKPFETVVGLDEKLSLAMTKCAEHFEKSLDKLRFEFDGDSLSAKSTPRDLELEGGECVDVKILS